MKPMVMEARKPLAELLGTMLLVAAVVGSGIMAERLADGNVAVALLANTVATAAALLALITAFAPVSGAHFNPIVTLVEAFAGRLSWRAAPSYLMAQAIGAVAGTALAHHMFGLATFTLSRHERAGAAQIASEAVATFGLLLVIAGVSRSRPAAVPACVAAYIASAYWFTASTSFANPAVTLARALSDTFAGIRPADVPGFLLGQAVGAVAAVLVTHVLWGSLMTKTVVFACVHNAGRSQMAAAFFNALADPTKAKGISAGTQPGAHVHPEVLAAMKEVGIDLSSARPRLLTDQLARGAHLLITMGCGEACPAVPGLARDDWPLADPKGKSVEHVRAIRDDVRGRVVALLAKEGWSTANARP